MSFFSQPKQRQQQPTDSNLLPQENSIRRKALRRVSSRLGLLVALLIMAASSVAYGGVLFYVSGLRTELNDIEQSIQAITINRNEAEERRILTLDRQLSSASQLIENHRFMSAMLNRLESITHPLIKFNAFNVKFQPGTNYIEASMDINGPSYRIIAEQLVSFQASEFINSVEVNEFSLTQEGKLIGRGLIRFNANILEAEEDFYLTTVSSPEPQLSSEPQIPPAN